tara:strand:- start:335 stop:475 length:141 start_codon:yes stop_codon:yes gene_type:complete
MKPKKCKFGKMGYRKRYVEKKSPTEIKKMLEDKKRREREWKTWLSG